MGLQIRNIAVILIAAGMFFGGMAYFGRGIYWAWSGTNLAQYLPHRGDDCDFQARGQEYSEFAKGIYPNKRLRQEGKPQATTHTVYPPYALPMFGVFFGSWSFQPARFILQALSLAALAVMMRYGWEMFRGQGLAVALLAAAIPWAFSGNRVAMGAGQFSIICMGLLCLQFMFQAKGRHIASGVCWALAMIKPQIALPFALVFLVERNWRALFAGGALLAGLSWFALAWTGVGIGEFLARGPGVEKMNFVKENPYSAGIWVNALGINPRTSVLVALGVLAALGIYALRFLKAGGIPILTVAAYCSVLGYALFYHRRYDNMMLLPMALALVLVFFRRGFTPVEWIVYGSFFVSVFLPAGIVSEKAPPELLALTAPVAAALLLLWRNQRPKRANRPQIQ